MESKRHQAVVEGHEAKERGAKATDLHTFSPSQPLRPQSPTSPHPAPPYISVIQPALSPNQKFIHRLMNNNVYGKLVRRD